MKKFYFIFAIFISTFLFSQTKLIAYKSHGGNMNHFEASVSKNIFDTNDSNLGLPPPILKIDSVIFLDNDKVKIITESKRFKQEEAVRHEQIITFKNSKKKFNKNDVDSVLGKYYYDISDKDSTIFLKYNIKKKHLQKSRIFQTKTPN